MERIYAFGVSVIESIQYWFADYEGYFELVNNLSNPNYVLEALFPLVAVLDSVFAAQLLLCMSFGSWLNAVMKWWFLEDRPYWWVKETDFYMDSHRPVLRQTPQSCETGPGSPSGHSQTIAMVLVLLVCWLMHLMQDRKCYVWWWKLIAYPICVVCVISVMLARMFVAAHFFHQTLLGALLGALFAPALCIYVCDPYVWQIGQHNADVPRAMLWHTLSTVMTVVIGFVTYFGLLLCGWDPLWTVKLAFKWCHFPEHIHVTTTPMFAFVHSTGHLLGWALCVTPAVARYRHDTKERSVIIAALSTGILVFMWKTLQSNIPKESAWKFYSLQFVICTVKPALLLRVTPWLATWPYSSKEKVH